MTTSTREAFERGTDRFNAHDIDGFTAMMADDVVFEAPGGARGEGKEACAAFYGGWLAAFPDAHVDIRSVHIVDDVAVEEGTFTGTHEGVLHTPSGDIPPTGRSVEVGYIQVIRYRDGKHASFHLMFDRLVMLEQLGLVPDPAAAG
jgi:steroid delta-isomerase-like uncharacterized protein